MNQRSLIAVIILAGIGSIGSVLAYTGTISANQGNFNNLTVLNTCTNCGGNTHVAYNVTSADTAGTMVIPAKTYHQLTINEVAGGGYDGTYAIEIQRDDGSWVTLATDPSDGNSRSIVGYHSDILASTGSTTLKYPYQVRVHVTFQASNGWSNVILDYS